MWVKKNIELNSKLLNKVSKSNCGDVILNSIEHITDALKLNKINGVITGNLFNFLGTGLEISRNLAIKSGVKLANFQKIKL